MTITLTARRAAIAVLAVITLSAVYLIGGTRAGGPAAAASTSAVNTSSTRSTTLPGVTVPGAAGAGITVGGSADVAGTPDTLRLEMSVVATAASVSQALAKANASADVVQKSLLANGVAKKDLQTSGLTISPSYDYSSKGTPRLKGYEVSESVTAKLRDLTLAGDAISKAVTAGGNAVRVNGISLDLEETGALVSKARDKAFADAKAKAVQYAKAAGRSLGDVVSITENVSNPQPPVYLRADAFASAKPASAPIQPGSQNVSVSVTVVFAMG